MQKILLSLIDADKNQPRQHFVQSELVELKNSISENGILQPLIVESNYDSTQSGRYLLIDGERRFRCATELSLVEVPVVIMEGPLTYEERTIRRFNIQEQHKNWNMFDKARAILQLKQESSMSNIDISRKLNIPAPIVHNWLSITEFSERAQELVINKNIQFTYLVFLIRIIKYYTFKTELTQAEVENKLFDRIINKEFKTSADMQKFSSFILHAGHDSDKITFLVTPTMSIPQLYSVTNTTEFVLNETIIKEIKKLNTLLTKVNTLDDATKSNLNELSINIQQML